MGRPEHPDAELLRQVGRAARGSATPPHDPRLRDTEGEPGDRPDRVVAARDDFGTRRTYTCRPVTGRAGRATLRGRRGDGTPFRAA
ncbi:hypothetical protein [Streptomyces europaeiscabiei]|uniref:hypothetical protein n=1 Tax=Streptomyces europaeiscabiei TaxID=146819 RepID=UPI002E2B3FF2|nr:hypothetical protein [Streptomyces europaeiscabiei]